MDRRHGAGSFSLEPIDFQMGPAVFFLGIILFLLLWSFVFNARACGFYFESIDFEDRQPEGVADFFFFFFFFCNLLFSAFMRSIIQELFLKPWPFCLLFRLQRIISFNLYGSAWYYSNNLNKKIFNLISY